MKQITLVLALLFGFGAAGLLHSNATVSAVQQASPKITFEAKSHDFGEIVEGEKVKTTFTFKNTGNAPLVISSVTASCGCTTPNWPKEPIAAGESSKIDVEFNSAGKSGNVTKTITIKHNAESATDYLTISCVVKKAQ